MNDATVLTCDRTNRQGVVHYINKVLLPQDHHVTIVSPPVTQRTHQGTHQGTHRGTHVRWEERVEERHDESGQDDNDAEDYVDPDLGPQPEVYRGRHRAEDRAGLQEHRFREDRVGPRPSQHYQHHNQHQQHGAHYQHGQRHDAGTARVQHSSHHYLQTGSNY